MIGPRQAGHRPVAIPFLAALRRNFQVLGALFEREALSRRRAPLEAILDILEPLVVICVWSIAIWFYQRHPMFGSSTLLFISTGLFPVYLFVHCGRRMRILAGRNRFAVEKRLDHVIVFLCLRVIDFAILGIVLFTALYWTVAAEAYPTDIVPIFQACASMVVLGFGFAMINMAMTQLWWLWGYILPGLARLLMLFSGVHHILDYMPPDTRYILSFNPIAHAVILFRTGFYPTFPHGVLDTSYLLLCCVVSIFLGLVVERVSRRRADAL